MLHEKESLFVVEFFAFYSSQKISRVNLQREKFSKKCCGWIGMRGEGWSLHSNSDVHYQELGGESFDLDGCRPEGGRRCQKID